MNAIQPCQDLIVDEIHNTREQLAELYHNDLVAYSKAAQEHCLALGFSLVDSPRLRHWAEIEKNAVGWGEKSEPQQIEQPSLTQH